VPEFIRPLFCEGKGPFPLAALSGDPQDIHRTDEAVLEMFPADEALGRWIRLARDRVAFQGLPARICWLGYGDRARFGLAINDLVAKGAIKAPIVIGRDHLDAGSVASPLPRDRGNARRIGRHRRLADPERPAQTPPPGASWVSVHQWGRRGHRLFVARRMVGRGRRDRGGGGPAWSGCSTPIRGTGVMRHADAGYRSHRLCQETRASSCR